MKNINVFKNLRTDIDKQDLSELMANIRENGLLQPIVVWKENESYFIKYGHKRFAALKKLGRKELVIGKEVLIVESPTTEEFIIAGISENWFRGDNSPLERAKQFKELIDLGYSKGEIAVKFGIAKHKVEDVLELTKNFDDEDLADTGFIPDRTNKKGKISVTVMTIIGEMTKFHNLPKEVSKKAIKLAKQNEWSATDVALIRRIMANGATFDEAVKQKDKYSAKSIAFVINRKELEKNVGKGLQNKSFTLLARKIMKGEIKPIPNLIY